MNRPCFSICDTMNNFMVESGDESIIYIWGEISLQPCNTGYLTLDTFEGRIYMEGQFSKRYGVQLVPLPTSSVLRITLSHCNLVTAGITPAYTYTVEHRLL